MSIGRTKSSLGSFTEPPTDLRSETKAKFNIKRIHLIVFVHVLQQHYTLYLQIQLGKINVVII